MYNFTTFKKEHGNTSKIEESVKINKHSKNMMYSFDSFKEIQIIKESLNVDNWFAVNEADTTSGSTTSVIPSIAELIKGSDLFKDLQKSPFIKGMMTLADSKNVDGELRKFAKKYKTAKFAKAQLALKLDQQKEKLEREKEKADDEGTKEQIQKKIDELDKIKETNEKKIDREMQNVGLQEKELDNAISKLTGTAKDKATNQKRQTKLGIDIAFNKYLDKLDDDKIKNEMGWTDEEMNDRLADMDDLENATKQAEEDYENEMKDIEADAGKTKQVIMDCWAMTIKIMDKVKQWEEKEPDAKSNEKTVDPDQEEAIGDLKKWEEYYAKIISACNNATKEQRKDWDSIDAVVNDPANTDIKGYNVPEDKPDALLSKVKPDSKFIAGGKGKAASDKAQCTFTVAYEKSDGSNDVKLVKVTVNKEEQKDGNGGKKKVSTVAGITPEAGKEDEIYNKVKSNNDKSSVKLSPQEYFEWTGNNIDSDAKPQYRWKDDQNHGSGSEEVPNS